MNKKSILTIGLSLIVIIANAQEKQAIEATIRTLEQKVVKGILDADTVVLKQLWSPDFMVNTPRNNVAPSRQAVLKIQKAGMINYRSFEKVIENINIQDNLVITMGLETYVPNVDLAEAKAGETVKRRFTNVWIKQKDQWVQIARHASVICR